MARVFGGAGEVRGAPQPRRRRGAIMVVVAGGMIALMLFASFAVDVAYMHLTRARAEAAARAAARAGLEKLKSLDFDLTTGNEAIVEATIRDYIEQNAGASGVDSVEAAAMAAAATVTVERCGEIDVRLSQDSPIFFGRLSRSFAGKTSTGVSGTVDMSCNRIAPFAIPSTYQDPDQDGYSNWEETTEEITTAVTPWSWTVDKPYIIKYGKDSGQVGDNSDWVFIPMDDSTQTVTLPNGTFTLDSQDMTGSLDSNTRQYNISYTYAQRLQETRKCDIGVLRAYGVAYDVAGVSGASLFWVLGYHGGSFIMRAQDLDDGGYQIPTDGSTNFTILNDDGTSTSVKAQMLYSSSGGSYYDAVHRDFVNNLVDLQDDGDIRLMQIPKQPKIITFTENNDYVTMSMISAGIPFKAMYFDEGVGGFFDVNLPSGLSEAQYLEILKDTDGSDGGPFDWLHLHHENFAYSTSSNKYSRINFVGAISRFVSEEESFVFAACWAAETLEIALAKYGSDDWDPTSAQGVPVLHLEDYGISTSTTTQKIEYDKTFAMTDFFIVDDAGSSNKYQGNIPENRFGKDESNYDESQGDYTCGSSDCFDDSEIDNQADKSNPSDSRGGSNAHRRVSYVDYLNPLLQNHAGYLGAEYDETNEGMGTANNSDYVKPQSGATDSFRVYGSPWVHCDQINSAEPQPITSHPWHTSGDIEELDTYDDPSGGDRQWIDESVIGWDINGDGSTNYVRISDLPSFSCSGGPSDGVPVATDMGGGSYRIDDINCDGDNTQPDTQDVCGATSDPGNICGSSGSSNCDCCSYTGRGRRRRCVEWEEPVVVLVPEEYNNVIVDENDGGFVCYDLHHGHNVLKPWVVAQEGITEPQAVTGATTSTQVMILTRDLLDTDPKDTDNIFSVHYMGGISDTDGDETDGFGRWHYLGGHWPDEANGGYTESVQSYAGKSSIGVEGMRIYLNNVLFGSTAGIITGGNFTPGTGAVNPAALGLGSGAGGFGAGGFTGNSFRTMFRVGTKGLGLPVGTKYQTAPGNFASQTTAGLNFAFQDVDGTSTSITWDEFVTWRGGKTQDEISDHPQVFTIPIVERIPAATPATAPAYPTPESELDDWLTSGGSPAASANNGNDRTGAGGARYLSMYAGDNTLAEDDPLQARNLHIIGYAEFFLIDKANQGPNTQDLTGEPADFVAANWKDAEVRGYFLRYIEQPPTETVYPTSPDADPR